MEGELWAQLYSWIDAVDKGHRQDPPLAGYGDATVVRCYCWAVLHDRPVRWACDPANWLGAGPLRPGALPSQPTMSRRLRHPGVRRFLAELEALVGGAFRLTGMALVALLDGTVLGVARHSTDPDAGVGKRGAAWRTGYELHALWTDGPLPLSEVCPLTVSEPAAARRLLARVPAGAAGRYALADSQFDTNALHARCAALGWQLLAPPKRPGRAPGHRAHHPARLHALEVLARPFGRALRRARDAVERRWGNLTSFGGGLAPLPAWVRRLHRVRLWVRCKLIVNALRIQRMLEKAA